MRIVVGFHLDGASVMSVMVPIEQHGAERGHQPVGDVARAGVVMVGGFRRHASQNRNSASA